MQFGDRRTVNAGVREYTPGQQVLARAELHGPDGERAGADVRGDGLIVPYVGRFLRRPVDVADDETPYAALGRVLSDDGSTSVEP